jgi:hypothetical protein
MIKTYLTPIDFPAVKNHVEHGFVADMIEEAEDWFVDAKEKLLDVNNWERYCPGVMAAFRLADSHGNPIRRRAHRGDYIISDNANNGAITWLAIDAIAYDDYPDITMETFTMHLRSGSGPLHRQNNGHADSYPAAVILIERRGKKLSCFCLTDEDAFAGLQDEQWRRVVRGLVEPR